MRLSVYQALLAQQAEEQGVAHFPQVLETHGLQLSIFNDVLQLVVKEFQDSCEESQDVQFTVVTSSVQCSRRQLHDSFSTAQRCKIGIFNGCLFSLSPCFQLLNQQVQTLEQYTQLFLEV